MKVRIPESLDDKYVPEYLTKGKIYEDNDDEWIIDDENDKLCIVPEGTYPFNCLHLSGQAQWEIVEDD